MTDEHAVAIAEFAVGRLGLAPDDVLIVVPAEGVIDSAEQARELQEAIAMAFDNIGVKYAGVLVFPPGSSLQAVKESEVPPEHAANVHHHRDLAD